MKRAMKNFITEQTLDVLGGGRAHYTIDSIVALHPVAPGSIPGIPQKISEELLFLYEAKINRRHCCLE